MCRTTTFCFAEQENKFLVQLFPSSIHAQFLRQFTSCWPYLGHWQTTMVQADDVPSPVLSLGPAPWGTASLPIIVKILLRRLPDYTVFVDITYPWASLWLSPGETCITVLLLPLWTLSHLQLIPVPNLSRTCEWTGPYLWLLVSVFDHWW